MEGRYVIDHTGPVRFAVTRPIQTDRNEIPRHHLQPDRGRSM